MRHNYRWAIVALILAALALAACGQTPPASATKIQPATVEKIDGTEFNRVTLTEKAAQRINVQTTPVREEQVNGAQRKVIPYAAVIYGLKGETWTYTSAGQLSFVRQPITVDYIDGDKAILVDGPPAGTAVVTVGAPELYGADTGIGK
jgi:hypothetical protein